MNAARQHGSRDAANIGAWLLVALIIVGVTVGLLKAAQRRESELGVYLLAAQRMLEGANIYVPADGKPFTYPPFFALVFVPFAELQNSPTLQVAWFLFNLLILTLCIVMLGRWIRWLRPRATSRIRWVIAFVVLALCARHLAAVLNIGSHDLVLAGVLVLGCAAWMHDSQWTAGILAGIGVALKATPLLFGLLFLVRWRPKAMLGLLLAAAFATLLCELLPGSTGQLWVLDWWLTMIRPLDPTIAAQLDGVWEGTSHYNQSLTASVGRLVGNDASPVLHRAASLLAQTAIVAIVLWTLHNTRRLAAPLARLLEWSTILNGMLLLSPVTSKWHYCLWLVPAFVVGFIVATERLDRVAGGLAVGVVLTGTLTSKGVLGTELGLQCADLGMMTWSAVSMSLLLARLATVAVGQHAATPSKVQPTQLPQQIGGL